MISKQDFDLINRYIAQRNAATVTFKFLVIFTFGITALLFLCIGIVLPTIFFGMCLLAGLLLLPVILVLRIKPEPSYTFGQLVQAQAAQKFQLRQTEVHYAMQYGYPGVPIQDSYYIPDDLRRAVLRRDNYRCRSCGATASLELDHIIPRSQGGATSYKNLQVLCQGCSQRKGAW
jgi:hypothetical protein